MTAESDEHKVTLKLMIWPKGHLIVNLSSGLRITENFCLRTFWDSMMPKFTQNFGLMWWIYALEGRYKKKVHNFKKWECYKSLPLS